MKNVAFLMTLILLSGCVTQKKCLRKFPPQTVIERSDSIVMRDTIIYRDRVIVDSIPADTVFIQKILPIEVPVDLFVSPVEAENKYAKARAWIENKRLRLELTQKEQAIKKILRNAEKQEKYWMHRYYEEKITETTTEYKAKPIHKVSMWFSLVVILVSGIAIYLRFKR